MKIKMITFAEGIKSRKILSVYYPNTKRYDGNKFDFGEMRFVNTEKLENFQMKPLMEAEFVLEEKSITITESEFDESARKHVTWESEGNTINAIKKELGF